MIQLTYGFNVMFLLSLKRPRPQTTPNYLQYVKGRGYFINNMYSFNCVYFSVVKHIKENNGTESNRKRFPAGWARVGKASCWTRDFERII